MPIIQSLENKVIAWGWGRFAANAIRHKRTTIGGVAAGLYAVANIISFLGNGGTPDIAHIDRWAALLTAAWLGINGKDTGTQDVATDASGNPIPKAQPVE